MRSHFVLRAVVAWCVALAMAAVLVPAAPAAAAPPPLERRFLPPQPHLYGNFGALVAVDGNRMAILDPVGGYLDPERQAGHKIYVHRRDPGGWVLEATFSIPWGSTSEQWVTGDEWAFDIDGTTLVVGRPQLVLNGVSGRVEVYNVLNPSAAPAVIAPAPYTGSPPEFGNSVAIDGNRLVVGELLRDRAYIYERANASAPWMLASPGGTLQPGAPGALRWFGHDVSISGDRVAVGEIAYNAPGRVYVYRRDALAGWITERWFDPPAGSHDNFGRSVVIAGNQIAIRSPDTFLEGEGNAAFVSTRTGTSWSNPQMLTVLGQGDVAFDGTTLAVSEMDWERSVALVRLFGLGAGGWSETSQVSIPQGSAANYGASVDVAGPVVAVGAPWEPASGVDRSGAVYAYASGAAVLSPPGAPSIVSAVTGPGVAATVNWTPPATDGGTPVTQYVLRAEGGPTMVVPAPGTSAVLGGLTEWATYRFTVAAVNGIGEGPASAASAPVTIVGPDLPVESPFTLADPVGDASDNAGDIAEISVDYVDDLITVAIRTVAPEDPNTSLWWRPEGGGNWLYINFAAPAESHLMVFQHESTNASPSHLPGHDVIARFEFDDSCGRQVFPGEFVDGWFRTTFPATCVGSPFAVRFRASVPRSNDSSELTPPVLSRSTSAGGTGAASSEIATQSPVRLLDTRAGSRPSAGETVELPVAGQAGVPGDAVAAVLNLTGTEAQADGFVTAWPCGQPRPLASNLNLTAGSSTPNLAIVPLGVDGKVCLFTQSGTHLIADLFGWFPAGSSFTGISPERLLDTRGAALPGPGETVELQVAGQAGVPSDAIAAVLNLTGTEALADGFVTAWPCGQPRPLASNLNLTAGASTPNLAIVPLGADGKVCLFTQSGTHLIADLFGWFPAGSSFTGISPERLLDTRGAALPGPGQTVELQVAGQAGVPSDAIAAVLNLTGTEASADGFVTAWPCGQPRPLASNLNLTAGASTPNLAIVQLGVDGKVCLFTQSGTHLVADLFGWFPA